MRHIDNPIIEIGIPEIIPRGRAAFLYSPEDSIYREGSDEFYSPGTAEMILDDWRWEPWYKNVKPRLSRGI